MTRPLSNDLRARVVAAVAGGESRRAVAARFDVAVSSVVKWCQRYRATGSVNLHGQEEIIRALACRKPTDQAPPLL
jgi:transposase